MSRNGTGGPPHCQRTGPLRLRDTPRRAYHRHPPGPSGRARSTRRSRPPGTPFRAARSRRRSCGSRPTRASSASDRATRWTASRPSSTCSSAGSAGHRPARPGRSRRSTSTPAATGRSRSPCGTSSGQVAGLPVATLFGGASDGDPGLRLVRDAAAAGRPGRVGPAPARGGLQRAQDPGRPAPARGGPRRRGGDPRTRSAIRWRSWSTSTRAGGWPATRRPSLDPALPADRRATRRVASCGWRSRWPARTCAGLAALRASAPGIRIAGGEMTRTFTETACRARRRRVRRPPARRRAAAGMLRGRTIAELALARNRWFTPHTWTNGIGLLANLHVAAGRRWRTVHRVPVRPARLDRRTPRLHARRTDPPRPRRDPARPAGAGPGSSSTRPPSGGSRPDAWAVPRLAGPRREGYTRCSEKRSHSL